jgi:hypothetical protein
MDLGESLLRAFVGHPKAVLDRLPNRANNMTGSQKWSKFKYGHKPKIETFKNQD